MPLKSKHVTSGKVAAVSHSSYTLENSPVKISRQVVTIGTNEPGCFFGSEYVMEDRAESQSSLLPGSLKFAELSPALEGKDVRIIFQVGATSDKILKIEALKSSPRAS